MVAGERAPFFKSAGIESIGKPIMKFWIVQRPDSEGQQQGEPPGDENRGCANQHSIEKNFATLAPVFSKFDPSPAEERHNKAALQESVSLQNDYDSIKNPRSMYEGIQER